MILSSELGSIYPQYLRVVVPDIWKLLYGQCLPNAEGVISKHSTLSQIDDTLKLHVMPFMLAISHEGLLSVLVVHTMGIILNRKTSRRAFFY